jgi:tetratricopeptide (TPR) repeat protein
VPAGSFSVRLVTAGGRPFWTNITSSSAVARRWFWICRSVRPPPPGKRLVKPTKLPAAIAKLEKAIRIDPSHRDAHCNLGVLYARVGRGPEALAEFHKAIDIGSPSAPIYADLALVSAAMRLFPEAESSARKALELDPANSAPQRVLERLVREAQ